MSLEDTLDAVLENELEDAQIKSAEQSKDVDDGGVEIPDKFKGKSLEDIVSSYTELERAYGRQANEFGELRKMTDQILLKQIESTNKTEVDDKRVEPVSFNDFVEDPENAVDKLVTPKFKELNDKLDAIDKKERLANFQSKFPDYQQDLADEVFQQWVQSSSYRTSLFQKADSYDVNAADELWSAWHERKELLGQAAQAAKDDKARTQEDALRKAATESSSTGSSSRKVFKRVDIIRLRTEDPDRYNELLPEIKKAYEEKRVI